MAGALYVVATPIGHLEDITYRAVRVLREADVIACEDTRRTRVLLDRYGITTPVVSYHEHNEPQRAADLIRRLRRGETVALVSDAGMPLMSDPGYALVRGAIDAEIPVTVVPGPSAITAALAVSGLPADHFVFLGFLPRRAGERRRALQAAAPLPWTLVIFETPQRLLAALQDMHAVLGNRRIAVVRELTKQFEEVRRGTIAGLRAELAASTPRGEYTLVVEGAAAPAARPADAERHLRRLLAAGTPSREAVRAVAEAHRLPRRAVYALMLKATGKR